MADWEVIVIGGGAAGLFCALTAGQRGRRVLVLERANKVGRKILMSGGGRCNFTNLYVEADCYLSANPHFCKSALSRYTQWDFISQVEAHGIDYRERKHGQLFCEHSAKDILAMLRAECDRAGVTIQTQCEISRVTHTETFSLATNHGICNAESLVVASGGLSIPSMGASNFGYTLARQFGIKVLPTRAGLVPFIFSGSFQEMTNRLSGVSLPVCIKTPTQSFCEDILFTHRGLSGPVVLQLSSYWKIGTPIDLNLLPEFDATTYLHTQKHAQPKKLLRNLLAELLPKKLVRELEFLLWQTYRETPLAEIPAHALAEIARQLHAWRLQPAGTEGYRTAEVTLGGIDTTELSSKTMESRRQPGLYFVGEVVDVTGQLGGFNFQWAWSSGHAAGEYV